MVARAPGTHEAILEVTDALGDAGCSDASIRGHMDGMELLFERTADSLQKAIVSAISDVEGAGYRVSRVELERDDVPDFVVDDVRGPCR
jgi:hypothetical protein